jgi:hypothetical protein
MHAMWKRPRCGDCGMPMRWPSQGRRCDAKNWSPRDVLSQRVDMLGDKVREDKSSAPYCALCFTAENTERAQNARDEKHPSPTYTVRVTSVIAKDAVVMGAIESGASVIPLADVSMFKEGQAIDIMSAPTRGDIRQRYRGREDKANTWAAIDPYYVQLGALLPYDPAHRFDYATGERVGGMYLRGTFMGSPIIEDTRLTSTRGEVHYRVRFDGAFNTKALPRAGINHETGAA